MLMEQLYPGDDDYILHFNTLLPAFKDPRYIHVEGKPLFVVYAPNNLPDAPHFIELWQQLARQNGLPGIHFVAHTPQPRPDDPYRQQASTPRSTCACLTYSSRTSRCLSASMPSCSA